MLKLTRTEIRYLIQEAILFLSLSYILLLGGTFNGLVLYEFSKLNLILFTLAGMAWLGWRIRGNRPFPATRLDGSILTLIAAFAITSWLSIDPRRSLDGLIQVLLYFLLFYLVVDLLRAGWPQNLFIKTMLLVSGFIVFFGLWEFTRWYLEWFSIGGFSDPFPPSFIRIRAFLGHPNFAAAFLNLMLPLGLAKVIEERRPFSRILITLWVVIVLFLIFLTSSRGGWLGTAALLASFVVMLGLDRPNQVRRLRLWMRDHRIVIGLIILALSVVAILFVPLLIRQMQHPSHGTNFFSRFEIWNVALNGFRSDPFSGLGPLTFGTLFTQYFSVPPSLLLAHGHSIVFNTIAEQGLIGLAALGFFIIAIVSLARRRWKAELQGSRGMLAGLLAALLGFFVHSLFDTPQTLPVLSIFALTIIGLIAYEDIQSGGRKLPRSSLVVGLIVVVVVSGISLRAYRPHREGVLASHQQEWEVAAKEMTQARELDPTYAFYWMQSGFAYGKIALEQKDSPLAMDVLQRAIESYERALLLEPSFATNWANYAILLSHSGDYAAAIDALTEAVTLAPDAAFFHLTLGRMFESAEQWELAKKEYDQALSHHSYWVLSYYFRETAFRAQYVESRSEHLPLKAAPALIEAWEALLEEDFVQARSLFEAGVEDTPAEAYLGMGLSNLGILNFEQADHDLQIADFTADPSSWTSVLVHLAQGKVQANKADCGKAIPVYERARELLENTTSQGIGTFGLSDYAWYVFNRESIPDDLLPGVEYILYTDWIIEAMLELAECYLVVDDQAKAVEIFMFILNKAPDNDQALDRLREFDPPTTAG